MKPIWDRDWYKVQLPTADGRWVRRALGTQDEPLAYEMVDVFETLVKKKAFDVLDRLTAKDATLTPTALVALWRATPSSLHNKRTGAPMAPGDDERLEYVRQKLTAPPLNALITQWAAQPAIVRNKGRYVETVRRLYPLNTTATIADFTQQNLARHLKTLGVSENSKRRHRAAFSSLGNFLLDPAFGFIATNPAKSVPLGAIEPHQAERLTPEQARDLVEAFPCGPQQALEALMAGTGLEWSAIVRKLTKSQINFETRTLFGDGRKLAHKARNWRSRTVEVTEEWAWKIFAAYAKPFTPTTPLFTLDHGWALKMHHQTAEGLNLPRTKLHAYRHTFACMWIARGAVGGLRADGRNERWLKRQLGHSPASTLLHTLYGVEIERAEMEANAPRRVASTGPALVKTGTDR